MSEFTKLPRFIEIEIGTYCNRTCKWCPNGWDNRGRQKNFMNDEVWEKIISDLSELNYSGWLAFHNYNEPLADPTIFEKIKKVNHDISTAKTTIYSNGDYFTKNIHQRLLKLEVNEIRITLYPKKKDAFKAPKREKIFSFLEKIDLTTHCKIKKGRRGLELRTKVSDTEYHIIVPKIASYSDRAGNVKIKELKLNKIRTTPCHLPKHSAAIDFRGNLKLCCQIYDVTLDSYQDYCIGNILEYNFKDLWLSQKMQAFRKQACNGSFKGMSACHYCSHALNANKKEKVAE